MNKELKEWKQSLWQLEAFEKYIGDGFVEKQQLSKSIKKHKSTIKKLEKELKKKNKKKK